MEKWRTVAQPSESPFSLKAASSKETCWTAHSTIKIAAALDFSQNSTNLVGGSSHLQTCYNLTEGALQSNHLVLQDVKSISQWITCVWSNRGWPGPFIIRESIGCGSCLASGRWVDSISQQNWFAFQLCSLNLHLAVEKESAMQWTARRMKSLKKLQNIGLVILEDLCVGLWCMSLSKLKLVLLKLTDRHAVEFIKAGLHGLWIMHLLQPVAEVGHNSWITMELCQLLEHRVFGPKR